MTMIAGGVRGDIAYNITWPLWQNRCKGNYLHVKGRLFVLCLWDVNGEFRSPEREEQELCYRKGGRTSELV